MLIASSGPAVAKGPGEAALALVSRMESAGEEVKELLTDSVLSPHCGGARREAIVWHLGGMARALHDS
jgi:hypothetical protein